MFKKGQRIVCLINFPPIKEMPTCIYPKAEVVYTCREYGIAPSGYPYVLLEEINNKGKHTERLMGIDELSFGAIHFRAIDEMPELDAQISEALKSPTPVKKFNTDSPEVIAQYLQTYHKNDIWK